MTENNNKNDNPYYHYWYSEDGKLHWKFLTLDEGWDFMHGIADVSDMELIEE